MKKPAGKATLLVARTGQSPVASREAPVVEPSELRLVDSMGRSVVEQEVRPVELTAMPKVEWKVQRLVQPPVSQLVE